MGENSEWIDVSVPIQTGMVHWPGDPPIEISHVLHLDRGDVATVSQLNLGAHAGTHVDAPNHFLPGKSGVDSISIDPLIGTARVIELPEAKEISAESLKDLEIREGDRILFKTSNSLRCWESNEFVRDFVPLTRDAAEFLAHAKIQTVGIDYLSVGKGDDGPQVHRTLLGSDICIIEGLNLSKVSGGTHELLCLPIRLKNGDGAPARAFLRKKG